MNQISLDFVHFWESQHRKREEMEGAGYQDDAGTLLRGFDAVFQFLTKILDELKNNCRKTYFSTAKKSPIIV